MLKLTDLTGFFSTTELHYFTREINEINVKSIPLNTEFDEISIN